MKTININDTNELRISESEYKGKKYVDIRQWWHDGDHNWKPGKGITIKENQWEEFKEFISNMEPEF